MRPSQARDCSPAATVIEEVPGVDGFIAAVERLVACFPTTPRETRRFILAMGEAYAYIRMQDVWRVWRFLKQMAGTPPVTFGPLGFKSTLVDDANPARHYTAFVFVGYWLPRLPAVLVLWLWELAGYVRYRGHWSRPDLRMGYVGIAHGRQVRRHGHAILPSLIARDLAGP